MGHDDSAGSCNESTSDIFIIIVIIKDFIVNRDQCRWS